jgi:hypothetical protein
VNPSLAATATGAEVVVVTTVVCVAVSANAANAPVVARRSDNDNLAVVFIL